MAFSITNTTRLACMSSWTIPLVIIFQCFWYTATRRHWPVVREVFWMKTYLTHNWIWLCKRILLVDIMNFSSVLRTYYSCQCSQRVAQISECGVEIYSFTQTYALRMLVLLLNTLLCVCCWLVTCRYVCNNHYTMIGLQPMNEHSL